MNYLIKYGLMVALVVTLGMNIIEPSLEHKLLQSVIAIGVLLFFYVEWSMERIYKKLLKEIKKVPAEDEKKITTPLRLIERFYAS